VNQEVTGSSGGLYTLHDVWERPPANNLPQNPHSAGAYGTGYVLFLGSLSTLSKDFNNITISKQCERNSIEEAVYTEPIMQITKLNFKFSGE